MKKSFDQIVERYQSDCRKWDNVVEIFGAADVLPLWIADMDFVSPPAVVKALQDKADHGVYGYPAKRAVLHKSVQQWLERRHQWSVDLDWISTAPGVVSSISAAVLTLTQPGDGIIIQPPVYPPFFSCVRNNGRRIVENALKHTDGYYEMDFDDLESKIDETVKMLILCSPHNPVGRVWTEAELRRLAAICAKHNIIILADEIHNDLVFPEQQHTPLASLSEAVAKLTVTFVAASKTFNVAGLNTSFIITPDQEKRDKINHLLNVLEIGKTTIFGGAATQAAYHEGEQWLDELRAYLSSNADFISAYLTHQLPEVRMVKPQATYLAWLDFGRLFPQPDRLKAFLIQEAKVGLNDGLTFGSQGAGFARLNFGCPRVVVEQALERITRAVAQQRIK